MTNNHNQNDNTMTTTTTTTDHHNHNNNNIAHDPGRFMTAQDYTLIREAYCDNVGPMTAAIAKMIETAFNAGLDVDEIVMAIEETGMAPRPTPYYLRAILRSWAENGVTISRIQGAVWANNATKWWKSDKYDVIKR